MSLRPHDLLPLYQRQQQRRIELFESFLPKIERRIVLAAQKGHVMCVYHVPAYVPGHALFDASACAAYLILRLRRLDYQVTFTPPATLWISWGHAARVSPLPAADALVLATQPTPLALPPGLPAPSSRRPPPPPPFDPTERLRRVYSDLPVPGLGRS